MDQSNDENNMFTNVMQLACLLFTSIFVSILCSILYLLNNNGLNLILIASSSLLMIYSLTSLFLLLAYYDKFKKTDVKLYGSNVFNMNSMIIFIMLVLTMFLLFGTIIYTTVTNSLWRYILLSVYGTVLLIIIIQSIYVVSKKKIAVYSFIC